MPPRKLEKLQLFLHAFAETFANNINPIIAGLRKSGLCPYDRTVVLSLPELQYGSSALVYAHDQVLKRNIKEAIDPDSPRNQVLLNVSTALTHAISSLQVQMSIVQSKLVELKALASNYEGRNLGQVVQEIKRVANNFNDTSDVIHSSKAKKKLFEDVIGE